MIRALCWKEYRAHRTSWLLVAGIALTVGCGLALILPRIWPSATLAGSLSDAAAWLALGMSSFYGLICGTLLLAGEREARVMDYLDRLGSGRAAPWILKAILGVGFTLAQGLLLGGLAVLVGRLDGRSAPLLVLALLPLQALDGLVWGLAASALTRRCAVALPLGLVLQAGAWGVAVWLGWLVDVHFIAMRVMLSGAAALFSYLVFARSDLSRAAPTSIAGLVLGSAAHHGWFEATIVAWFALLLPRSDPVHWPFGVVLIGVVFGAMAFAGEQKDGKTRFLGEHWLSLHKAWLLRTAGLLVGAVVTSAAVLLAAHHVNERLASLRSSIWSVQEMRPVAQDGPAPGGGPWAILALVLLTGFSAGQFGGLVLRRRFLALAAGLAVSAALLALWLPSLMLGGQAIWPLLLPPVLLMVAVGFVVWGKSNGHAHTRRCLVGCSLLMALWVSGILWYRVAEIPEVEHFDCAAFELTLSPQDNDGGVLLRQVCEELERKRWPDDWVRYTRFLLPDEFLGRNLEDWWAKEVDQLWMKDLDALFATDLARRTRKAASLPLGVLRDPRTIDRHSQHPELYFLPKLGSLFLMRASQLQARGAHAESLEHLAVILALSRQLRNNTPLRYLEPGEQLEWKALSAFELWLQHVGARPALLRRAAEVLQRHEEKQPLLSDNFRAEYHGFSIAIKEYIDKNRGRNAWLWRPARALPWERAREQRQIDLLFAEPLARLNRPYWEAFPPSRTVAAALGVDEDEARSAYIFVDEDAARRRSLPTTLGRTVWWPLACECVALRKPADTRAYHLTLLRAAQLQTALARYSVENAKQAATLSDLVPRYLAELPLDPFNGRGFGYRISQGEEGFGEQVPGRDIYIVRVGWTQPIPAGRGLVWSAGPDQVDHGGKKQGRGYRIEDIRSWDTHGLDLIFLVPQLSKK